jgi:hypothetical protein
VRCAPKMRLARNPLRTSLPSDLKHRSFENATLGKIVCTLVAFKQARAALEDCPGTLVMWISNVEGHPVAEGRTQARRQKINLRLALR